MTARTWLWPDRTIGKMESRLLREEHNATVNALAALLDCIYVSGEDNGIPLYGVRGPIHEAVTRVKGGQS